jgi:hypothetical protein
MEGPSWTKIATEFSFVTGKTLTARYSLIFSYSGRFCFVQSL